MPICEKFTLSPRSATSYICFSVQMIKEGTENETVTLLERGRELFDNLTELLHLAKSLAPPYCENIDSGFRRHNINYACPDIWCTNNIYPYALVEN